MDPPTTPRLRATPRQHVPSPRETPARRRRRRGALTCSVQRVADRQVLEPADERRRHGLWITSQLNRFQPRYQLGEETADLHAGQRSPQTEVHSVTESQMLVGIAADVEAERIGEDLFIPIGRYVGQQQ